MTGVAGAEETEDGFITIVVIMNMLQAGAKRFPQIASTYLSCARLNDRPYSPTSEG